MRGEARRIACYAWVYVTFHLHGKEDFFNVFWNSRKCNFDGGVLVVISNDVLFLVAIIIIQLAPLQIKAEVHFLWHFVSEVHITKHSFLWYGWYLSAGARKSWVERSTIWMKKGYSNKEAYPLNLFFALKLWTGKRQSPGTQDLERTRQLS